MVLVEKENNKLTSHQYYQNLLKIKYYLRLRYNIQNKQAYSRIN